jgi:5'-methylthioadenosine phosphorylase
MVKIGIIGGSGLDNPELISDYKEQAIETEYGKPSSNIICGKIKGVDICILSRHGPNHEIPPSRINYRANIMALKKLGCTHILASSAVGSLRENIKPGNLVFPSQFIDFTKQRKVTFFDEIGKGKVQHPEMAEPYSNELRNLVIEEAENLGYKVHKKATIIVIEGPRFSTKVESNLFRKWGADIIGMTTVPECNLAKEQEIKYATIAMTTDYDCWKQDEASVSWEMIKKRMEQNADKVKNILLNCIEKIKRQEQKSIEFDNKDIEFIKSKIRTIPNWPRLGVMFRDITTLLKDTEGMKKVISIFEKRYKNQNIDIIAGIESRGFIIGGILADKLGIPFVPLRKPGKLPSETIKQEYELEYGTDAIEIHKDAISSGDKVLLIDDLLATGGTASAACNLIEKLEGEIKEVAFVIELPDLKGRNKLRNRKVFSIVSFEGE